MLTGKWTTVNQHDRRKMKDLVQHHGNLEKVAKLIGVHENTLRKWMDKEDNASFRDGARTRLKNLINGTQEPLVAEIRETVFAEEPHWLTNVIELRDALDTVVRILHA